MSPGRGPARAASPSGQPQRPAPAASPSGQPPAASPSGQPAGSAAGSAGRAGRQVAEGGDQAGLVAGGVPDDVHQRGAAPRAGPHPGPAAAARPPTARMGHPARAGPPAPGAGRCAAGRSAARSRRCGRRPAVCAGPPRRPGPARSGRCRRTGRAATGNANARRGSASRSLSRQQPGHQRRVQSEGRRIPVDLGERAHRVEDGIQGLGDHLRRPAPGAVRPSAPNAASTCGMACCSADSSSTLRGSQSSRNVATFAVLIRSGQPEVTVAAVVDDVVRAAAAARVAGQVFGLIRGQELGHQHGAAVPGPGVPARGHRTPARPVPRGQWPAVRETGAPGRRAGSGPRLAGPLAGNREGAGRVRRVRIRARMNA